MPYHYTHGSPLYNDPSRYGLHRRGETFDFPGGPGAAEWQAVVRARAVTLLDDMDGAHDYPTHFLAPDHDP